jgi:hypothetical protein
MLLLKFESSRTDLARCRTGKKHEIALARDLPVGSRVDFDCDARQRKILQSQCAMATGSNKFLAALYLALFGNDIDWPVAFGFLTARKGGDRGSSL